MAGVQYKIGMTCVTTGALNPAFCTFATDGTGPSAEEVAAQLCIYLAATLQQTAEQWVSIISVEARIVPGGSWVPVPDFTTEFNALRAGATTELDSVPIDTWTGYPYLIDTGNNGTSSGRGDSMCVNTRAAGAGKHGRGRHFLPFLCREIIGTDGLLNSATIAYVEHCYRYCLQGLGTTPIDDLEPQVFSETLGTISPVTFVQVNNIPSRLRSRTK